MFPDVELDMLVVKLEVAGPVLTANLNRLSNGTINTIDNPVGLDEVSSTPPVLQRH